jgi:hypothetical protein
MGHVFHEPEGRCITTRCKLYTETGKHIKRDKNFYGPERNSSLLNGETEQLFGKDLTAYFNLFLWLQSVYTSEVG